MKGPQEVRGLREAEVMKSNEAQRMVVSWEFLKLNLQAWKETTNTVIIPTFQLYVLHSTQSRKKGKWLTVSDQK